MAKDYAKTHSKRRRTDEVKKRRVLLVVTLLIFISAAISGGFFFGSAKSFKKVLALLHPQKTAAPLKLAAAKTPPADTTVHFDFYDALPKMQMRPTLAENESAPTVKPIATTPKPTSATPATFSEAQVTDLLANEKTVVTTTVGQHYHLQLGNFDTESAAALLVDAVNSIGFQARVVKIHHEGHNRYQVTEGPFTNMELAKASQLRLQKRGITSTLKKG